MDFFHEHLYKRRKRFVDILIQIIITTVAVVGAGGVFIAARAYLTGFGSILGALGAFGIVYVAYLLLMQYAVEYELTYYNGEIDVDKILGQAKRKRLITVDAKKFDSFGIFDKVSAQNLTERHFDTQIDARSFAKDATVYYATLKHPKRGLTLVVFEPDEPMLKEIERMRNPYSFRRNDE